MWKITFRNILLIFIFYDQLQEIIESKFQKYSISLFKIKRKIKFIEKYFQCKIKKIIIKFIIQKKQWSKFIIINEEINIRLQKIKLKNKNNII